MDFVVLVTVILALLNVADWYTTRKILKSGGTELNPLDAVLFKKLPIDLVCLVKTIGVTCAGYYLGSRVLPGELVIVALYVWVVWHNVQQLKK